ncbi:MORN repeat-containing protein [Turneriella parva]|uniref:MORN repeat-containing protein n=1 Tax=Turneriella parva (strain ATCC BAA-1111 / DSM 21527 / NCTC 11395 / H) TaxID=869212 RepID=I4BA22_TURPD|nr:MORN repeat-containing protein [Turneriella parva]AFM14129.1 MORN repeat-containing protein [Turneriella parva DSM 21527]
MKRLLPILFLSSALFPQIAEKSLFAEEAECQSGNCQDGFGRIRIFPQSRALHMEKGETSYEGNFRRGLRHGKGIIRYSNGIVYEGLWQNDLYDGPAKITFNDQSSFQIKSKQGVFSWRNKIFKQTDIERRALFDYECLKATGLITIQPKDEKQMSSINKYCDSQSKESFFRNRREFRKLVCTFGITTTSIWTTAKDETCADLKDWN